MLSFFPRGHLDEILNLIESVSEGFPSYSFKAIGQELLEMKIVWKLSFYTDKAANLVM